MNHAYTEEHDVAERYVLGQLPPDEAERFEEHYLSCQECLDRLEVAESMERGFKRAAGQEVAAAAVRQLTVAAWFSRLGRSRQMAALLMGLFVLLVVPGVLTVQRFGRLDRELADARGALAREREAGGGRGAEVQELQSNLAESRGALERESQARTRAEEQLAEALKPQANFPILPLAFERGTAGEPTYRVRRVPGSIVVLTLQLEPPHPPSYLAVVKDARGRQVERFPGLRPDETDSLRVMLPFTKLEPGDYTVTVSAGRSSTPVGRFPFRVLAP